VPEGHNQDTKKVKEKINHAEKFELFKAKGENGMHSVRPEQNGTL